MKSLLKLGLAFGIAAVVFTLPGASRLDANTALCCADCGPYTEAVCCSSGAGGGACVALDNVGCSTYVNGQPTPTYCPSA